MTKQSPLSKTMGLLQNDTNLFDIFKFNEFSEDVEYTKTPEWDLGVIPGKSLDDQDLTQLRYYLGTIHDFEPARNIIGEACFLMAKRKSYHPIKKYIESVKWDNVKRIDTWLIDSINCDDNVYTRMASSKFLIAAVNRVYNPGCKFDHMLILEGPQGIGKSTLAEIMAGDWYLDTNFDHRDKDLIDSMRSSFIIEISELSGMNKKDVDWLKSFLSKKVDRIRLPYASRSKDFKRKSVFIGTYNPSGNNMYLRDDTGNRRFWPIECRESVNLAYLRANKAQLWAEAHHRYKLGEQYYIDDKVALMILANIHNDRELESPTHIMIREWLGVRNQVAMNEIIQDCLKINMEGKRPKDLLSAQTTIGIIMRKLKWRKGCNENRHIYYSPDNGDLL